MKTVAVIGLGMIGGSVARALAAQGVRVVGYDVDESHLESAVNEGVVKASIPADFSHLADADTVVIAVYGDSAVDVLHALEPHANNLELVTDVGSTKRAIVSAANESVLAHCFVGAHPYAGDHRSGWNASRSEVFANELVYLSPSAFATQASIARARSLWELAGARTSIVDAVEHDESLAWMSHLPHVLSTAFAMTLREKGIPKSHLGRGGRDVARLAGGSAQMWTAISLDNAESIEKGLSVLQAELDDFRKRIASRSADDLREWFTRAREWTLAASTGES
jgi:prephenate dehydrogenase